MNFTFGDNARRTLVVVAAVIFAGCDVQPDSQDPSNDDDSFGQLESELQAGDCTSFNLDSHAPCSRPVVSYRGGMVGYNSDYSSYGAVPPGDYGMSACSPEWCVIYAVAGGGHIYTVQRTILSAHVASPSGVYSAAVAARLMTYTTNPGPTNMWVVNYPVPDPPQLHGIRPKGGSNNSITGRNDIGGGGLIRYGVERPNADPGSQTGFAGFGIGQFARVVDTGTPSQYGTKWTDANDNPAGLAEWRLVWVPWGSYWVKEWVVKRVSLDDGSYAADLLIP